MSEQDRHSQVIRFTRNILSENSFLYKIMGMELNLLQNAHVFSTLNSYKNPF